MRTHTDPELLAAGMVLPWMLLGLREIGMVGPGFAQPAAVVTGVAAAVCLMTWGLISLRQINAYAVEQRLPHRMGVDPVSDGETEALPHAA